MVASSITCKTQVMLHFLADIYEKFMKNYEKLGCNKCFNFKSCSGTP